MSHPVQHLEISATDRVAAVAFFSAVFNFDIQDFPESGYAMIETGEGSPSIALLPVSDDNPAGRIVPYFTTDDVAATLARASTAGGTVITESMAVPGVGDIGVFADPTGNVMGVWKPENQ